MEIKPEIRFLKDMKSVLYDQKWLKIVSDSNFEVYYIYRGVKKKDGLRYDITVIFPKMLGKEFPKTKGHIHKGNFPELYQVLEGKALFLFQKGKGEYVEDCYVVEAKKGDFVIVPPDYHHLTINPLKKKLKIGNWVSVECENVYHLFEKRQGACYYYLKSGWLKNKNYKRVPKLRFEKSLKSKPKNLDFLKCPKSKKQLFQ